MLTKYEPYQAKNALCRVDKNDEFNNSTYTLNPYRGCPVGCRYCFVQQKKYKDSTGLEEEKHKIVQVKINAPFLLRRKLSSGIEPAMICLGESCEPFADIEDEYFITQRLLEILAEYNYPLHILTRYPRILRDVDLIKRINTKSEVYVTISIPVVSAALSAKLEGDSPSVKDRLRTIRALNKNGIVAGVAISPVIPYISDGEEVNKVLKKASENGASYILLNPLVIKDYQREMFFSWLADKYPGIVDSYKRLYKEDGYPGAEYWDVFISQAGETAAGLDLKIGLPYTSDKKNEQGLLRFTDHVR
ncbi:MAG: radical SAM protein [Elusimicrobiota bacterium]